MRPLALALLAFGLTAACSAPAAPAAAAAKPPKAIHDTIAAMLDKAADENLRDPDQPRTPDTLGVPPAAMFSRLDVNADGVDDWRVDFEHAPNASLWCGSGGCRNEIWVSRPGGTWARAMERTAGTFKLTPAKAGARLDMHFHGSTCGGAGADECQRSYVWDEARGAFTEVANMKGQTYLAFGPAALTVTPLADTPAPVRAAVARLEATCKAGGGGLEEPASYAQDIPDIDGDGRRDWVIGGNYAYCSMGDSPSPAPSLNATVLATAGSATDLTVALERPELFYALDIGPKPAQVRILDKDRDCPMGQVCGKPLRWDAAAKRLVE